MELETVIVKKEDGIGTIMLNRPERLNALTRQMLDELVQAVDYVSKDDEIRTVVLTGAGRAFSAGFDWKFSEVRDGEAKAGEALGGGEGEGRRGGLHQGRLFNPLARGMVLGLMEMGKPTVAIINGDVVGAAFEFILACDIRVASDKARLGLGYTRIGLTPELAAPWLLPRIVGLGHALEFIMLSDLWSAEDAYRIGLVNRVLPADNLESEAMAMVRKLADGPPIGLRLSKLQVYNALRMDLIPAMNIATASQGMALMSEDHKEGILAFAQKRKPVFKDR